jgi:hypothetical protein
MKSRSSFVLFAVVCGLLAIAAYLFVFWYPLMGDRAVGEEIVQEDPPSSQAEISVDPSAEDTSVKEGLADLSFSHFLNLKVLSMAEVDGVKVRTRTGWIENPTRQVRQSVRIHEPVVTDEAIFPAVIFVPGGSGNGRTFDAAREGEVSQADLLASNGIVVITYSPLGTEENDTEPFDHQGYADQDGLAAIITATKSLTTVDARQIGVASFSYGITGASGALSRYPGLGVVFLVDWEGPSSREYTTFDCQGAMEMPEGEEDTRVSSVSCEDDAFWAEREAVNMIADADVEYYWRIQTKEDHVQSTYGHTLEMVNAAAGVIPWVRVNDGEVNAVYAMDKDIPVASIKNATIETSVFPAIVELISFPALAEDWFRMEEWE